MLVGHAELFQERDQAEVSMIRASYFYQKEEKKAKLTQNELHVEAQPPLQDF